MSRFVSAGSGESLSEEVGPSNAGNNDAWVKARAEVELAKRNEQSKGQQHEGKSLYEVLQANQAAKQEAFEESIRLKNQFRTLDEDEVDFLDSVLESTRAKQAAVRQETAEQLDQFRRQQEDATKSLLDDGDTEAVVGTEKWTAGKKRRRKDPGLLGTAKLRKSSSGAADRPNVTPQTSITTKGTNEEIVKPKVDEGSPAKETSSKSPVQATSPNRDDSILEDTKTNSKSERPKAAPVNLGLSGYSSSEDD